MNEAMDSRHIAECKAIRSMIDGIASLCAADTGKIIDLLKEYLWTDDEVKEISGQTQKGDGEMALTPKLEADILQQCKKCGADMKPGVAIGQTLTGIRDMGAHCTVSAGG